MIARTGQNAPMRYAWRLLLVLLIATCAYLLRLGSQDVTDTPARSPATTSTTCTTFANGDGGGWICER